MRRSTMWWTPESTGVGGPLDPEPCNPAIRLDRRREVTSRGGRPLCVILGLDNHPESTTSLLVCHAL